MIWNTLIQRWSRLGLRAKMGVLVEVGLVGLITVFLFLGVSTARQTTQQILNERRLLARLSAAALDARLQHTRSILDLLAYNLSTDGVPVRPASASGQFSPGLTLPGARSLRLHALQAASDQLADTVHGVYWLASDGQALDWNPDAPLPYWHTLPALQPPLAVDESFRLLLLPGENWRFAALHISGALADQPGSMPYVLVAVPLGSTAQAPVGWLVAVLDFKQMPFYQASELGRTGTLDLVDASGQIIASSRYPQSLEDSSQTLKNILGRFFVEGRPVAETCLGCSASINDGADDLNGQVLQKEGEAPAGGLLSNTSADANGEVIAFAPLSQAPWGVLVRQKASELMAPVNRLLVLTLLLGAATIFGALLMVRVTTNSIIRPVQTLQEAAEQIASGGLPSWTEENPAGALNLPLRRGDEIGALAASFEAMCRQLKQSMEEIEALNTDLDQRVQERTQAARQSQLEAQAARDHLLRRNRHISILNAVAFTLSQSLDLQDILQRALEAVLSLTDIDVGAVFLNSSSASILPCDNDWEVDGVRPEDDLQENLHLVAYSGLSPDAAHMAARLGMLDGSCGGVTNWVPEIDGPPQVVIVPDISRYRGRRARSLQRENLRSLAHVPLAARGQVLGSLCVGVACNNPMQEFDQEEQELLLAIGSQIAIAVENACLVSELQQKEHLRGELFKKVINAQEDERKRIARELHDDTSQSLAALLFAVEDVMASTAQDAAPGDGGKNRRSSGSRSSLQAQTARLQSVHDLLQSTLDGVHKLIFDLRPSMLDHLGLIPAVRGLAKNRLESKGVRVLIHENIQPECSPRLPSEMETALFRIVQEALTNIARHAAARNVHIIYTLETQSVDISIDDDGIGFEPLEFVPVHGIKYLPQADVLRGLGLLGMQERVDLLGGKLEILSCPGSGTSLHIHLPFNHNGKEGQQSL